MFPPGSDMFPTRGTPLRIMTPIKLPKRFALYRITLLLILSLSLLIPVHSRAEDGEIIQLRRKVSELEKRIRDLETRLQECEKYGISENISENGWRNKKNWRRLQVGMKRGQVEALLGKPVKVIKGVRTLWYYPNIFCGYVSFDEKGKVTGWSEP